MPALLLCLCTAPVHAHAPLPRALALSPQGSGLALSLPGFGLVLRPAGADVFSYACDALLGIPSSDVPPALAYLQDGALLVGSPGGLRKLAADGCPVLEVNTLADAHVVALAIHAASQIAYAVTTAEHAGVWRSVDAGVTWERRATLEQASQVTGLVLDPEDPAKLYLTRTQGAVDVDVMVSSDAGATFELHPQTRALRLLTAQASPLRLWAVARALDSKGNRGFDVLRAANARGPWEPVLRVNYFGGLTITPNGEIWVGDEGGGVYRSTDAGASFANVEQKLPVACLASDASTVSACTPALPTAPSLMVREEAQATFEPATTLADVAQLVRCAPQVEVARLCQGAWSEWQRDVRMPGMAVDAGTPQGVTDAAVPQPTAAESVDAGTPAPATASGCALTHGARSSSAPWILILCLGIACMKLRRRQRPPC